MTDQKYDDVAYATVSNELHEDLHVVYPGLIDVVMKVPMQDGWRSIIIFRCSQLPESLHEKWVRLDIIRT